MKHLSTRILFLVLAFTVMFRLDASAANDELSVTAPDIVAVKGQDVNLIIRVKGGTQPYKAVWYDDKQQEIDSESYFSSSATAQFKAYCSQDITVKVTDADGAVATAVQRIIVRTGDLPAATFDDIYLGTSRYANGRYKKTDDAPEKGWYNSFVSGAFVFHSLSSTIGQPATGCTVTNLNSSEYKPHDNDLIYAVAIEGGYQSSPAYLTVCDSAYITLADESSSAHPLSGFYISSSLAMYRSVVSGSDLSPEFQQGDYAYVTITNEAEDKSIDYYIADFRSDNEYDHYCIATWQWVDLRPLGKITGALKLRFRSNHLAEDGQSGFFMPPVFCIDDFNGTCDMITAPVQNVTSGSSIDLTHILSLPNTPATVTYSITDMQGGYSDDTQFEIQGYNLLVRASQCNVRLTICQKFAGFSHYASVPVVVSGTDAMADFENLDAGTESYVTPADRTFTSGTYRFTSDAFADNGFSYSSITASGADRQHQFRASAAGGGYSSSHNYAVLTDSGSVSTISPEHQISGFYVTSSAATYSDVTNGYSDLTRPFAQGDSLVLTIVNTDNGRKISYPIADYRSYNAADHYCLDTWQWVDLRSLGTANTLSLYLSSSQMLSDGSTGFQLNPFCCIDDFGGSRIVTQHPAVAFQFSGPCLAELPLADYFTFDNQGASTVTYTIDEITGLDERSSAAIEDGILEFGINNETTFTVVVRAFCRGIVQYASIPVTFTAGISNASSDAGMAARYTLGGTRVSGNTDGGVNIIRCTDGTVKKVVVR